MSKNTTAGQVRSPTRVTIKDVARAAKVSPMTVSNVINGKMQFVGQKTRETVEREIARLGYRVQSTGRSLRQASHRTVGMVIVDDSPSFLADPFTAHLVAGLSNTLSQHGFSLSVQGFPHQKFRDSPFLRTFNADAFCVLLSGPAAKRRSMVETLVALRQPVVLFQEVTRASSPDLCVIRQDDRGGGRLVASHVLERGARRIALLLPTPEWPAMMARKRGVLDVLRKAGEAVTVRIVQSATEDFESARVALATDLEENEVPDTIIAGNDRLAFAALALLQSRGLRVPDDVRVTGFNAFEPRKYTTPLLTTVASPAYAMGQRAGEIVLARLAQPTFADREIILPVALEIGNST